MTAPEPAGLPSRRRLRPQLRTLPASNRPQAPRREAAHLPRPGCGPCLLLCARKQNCERAADSGFAVDVHLPAVGRNDVLDHRQAETRPFRTGSISTGGTHEFFEDVLLLMGSDPHPLIAHANCYLAALVSRLRPDCLVLR